MPDGHEILDDTVTVMDLRLLYLPGLLAVPVVIFSATGGEPITVLVLAMLLGTAASLSGSLLAAYRIRKGKRVSPAVIVAAGALVVIASVPLTHGPLRMAFSWSHRALDTLAQRVRASQALALPAQAGIFIVREAGVSPEGIVCLWVDPNPRGRTGFVQTPRNHVPFNLWTMVSLDGRWQFITED